MKIIVAGAAEVGTHLAKLLAKENMDVVLMDADPEKIGQMSFMNLMTMVGKPTSITALKDAGVSSSDLFIAVTPDESVNIHACILAASLGARKTMARIDSFEMQKPESAQFYKRIGVSSLVYPELLAGEAVAAAIKLPWARMSFSLCDGHLLLLCVKVYNGAPLIGKDLIEIGKRHHDTFHIAAIKRGDDLIIPSGTDRILEGDIVYFITLPGKTDVIRFACGKLERHLNRVIIMGGGRMAIQTCYHLPKEYKKVLLDPDGHYAGMALEKVPDLEVIIGKNSDQDALADLHLGENDAVVALGEQSGENILACLTAKKLGVGKTVVEVGDVEYISMAANLNIGSTINKKILTASAIYQMLLDADKTSAKCFSLVDAEVADLEALPGSRITQSPVMKLSLPKGITLGGLVRQGVGMTVTGQTQIQPGDHVVVICMNDKIQQVERLFVK